MLDTASLDARIVEGMTEAKIPSVSLAVIHEGDVIHARGYGVTSVEDGGLPVTPNTLFRIASTSKPLAATLLLQLVAERRIDLDAPVKTYLPWFKLSDPAATEAVTVRHVMSGQSGLPADNHAHGGRGSDALERYVRETIPTYPLAAEPGKVFIYSNPAINLAGYIAESVAGVRFPDLVRRRIFEPLGMERSTYDPLVALTYPVALPHDVDSDGNRVVRHMVSDAGGAQPSGGAYSTALDMARFAEMLMAGGRPVLSEPELAEMTKPHSRTFWPPVAPFTPTTSYGLMLFIHEYKGRRRWGHAGGADGYIHTFELMPESRSAVIVQTNASGAGFSGHALADEIFDEMLGLPADWQTPAPDGERSRWDSYAGTYRNDVALYEGAKPVGELRVEAAGDELVAVRDGTTTALTAIAPGFYRATDSEQPLQIGFYEEPAGPVQWVSVNMQPARRSRA